MTKDEAVKLYQTYRLYIFPAIIVLSSLILIVFVIYPQTIKLFTNQKVKGEIFSKTQFLEVKAQALESYDPTDLNRKMGFAVVSYPTDKDFVSALGLLQNLITQSGFSTISISLAGSITSNKNAQAQSYNIKLDVLGPATSLPTLLSNIENSPRLMRVGSVEALSGKDPKGAIISLIVDVLYAPSPVQIGSVESSIAELSQKDEEIIAKLATISRAFSSSQQTATTQLGPRGKANPFE